MPSRRTLKHHRGRQEHVSSSCKLGGDGIVRCTFGAAKSSRDRNPAGCYVNTTTGKWECPSLPELDGRSVDHIHEVHTDAESGQQWAIVGEERVTVPAHSISVGRRGGRRPRLKTTSTRRMNVSPPIATDAFPPPNGTVPFAAQHQGWPPTNQGQFVQPGPSMNPTLSAHVAGGWPAPKASVAHAQQHQGWPGVNMGAHMPGMGQHPSTRKNNSGMIHHHRYANMPTQSWQQTVAGINQFWTMRTNMGDGQATSARVANGAMLRRAPNPESTQGPGMEKPACCVRFIDVVDGQGPGELAECQDPAMNGIPVIVHAVSEDGLTCSVSINDLGFRGELPVCGAATLGWTSVPGDGGNRIPEDIHECCVGMDANGNAILVKCPEGSGLEGTPVVIQQYNEDQTIAVVEIPSLGGVSELRVCPSTPEFTNCCYDLEGQVLVCDQGRIPVIDVGMDNGIATATIRDGRTFKVPVCKTPDDTPTREPEVPACCVDMNTGLFVCPSNAQIHGQPAPVRDYVQYGGTTFAVFNDGNMVPACYMSCPDPQPCPEPQPCPTPEPCPQMPSCGPNELWDPRNGVCVPIPTGGECPPCDPCPEPYPCPELPPNGNCGPGKSGWSPCIEEKPFYPGCIEGVQAPPTTGCWPSGGRQANGHFGRERRQMAHSRLANDACCHSCSHGGQCESECGTSSRSSNAAARRRRIERRVARARKSRR